MASISYAGLLFLHFAMILLALENTVANGHEGKMGTRKEWLRAEDDETLLHMAVYDGTVDGVISAKKPPNGRKLLQGAANKRSSHTSASADDSKAFLEAADEVANLMRRDYGGKDKPKRKPPINNHEPTD